MSEEATMTPEGVKDAWLMQWPRALACWSKYTQLSEPVWCLTREEEKEWGLTGSFAMIRLVDHRVVISPRQVAEQGLGGFGVEVLAHEIGHHVYCPADLTDNARLLVRLRYGLPTVEQLAPFVGNLYTDLLINDRLQRSERLNMAGVYRALNAQTQDRLWLMYMRTYEMLWGLSTGTLALGKIDARIQCDAGLCARLIRAYGRDWIDGAGRFAALCLPYLEKDKGEKTQQAFKPLEDAKNAGAGGEPDGLTEVEEGERDAMHPAEDGALSGLPERTRPLDVEDDAAGQATGETGRKSLKQYRGPVEYAEVMKAAGVKLGEGAVIAKYYRERAMPHLIKFPVKEMAAATDPIPEGLDMWDLGQPLEDVDWLGSVSASPVVIPGMTTRQRMYGNSPGTTPEKVPIDLYLGVDCSGSMGNPATQMSYPVLAGAIMALSALRAGASVMVALSGEPGRTVTTEGFVRDEGTVLTTLTGYLGTGTTFGIHRLDPTFKDRRENQRSVHILIITDNDIFSLLERTVDGRGGWDVARDSVAKARGGGTYVLQLPGYLMRQAAAKSVVSPGEERMIRDGWGVAHVDTMEELVAFAKRFSEAKYGQALKGH